MKYIRPEDMIVIDIETAPQNNSYENMEIHWQELWQDKIARNVPDNTSAAEFYGLRAGVMAEFSKVICISIGYFNNEGSLSLRVKSFSGDDENHLLLEFIETINKIERYNSKWCFAGHNLKEFDIPFICRRLIINGISLPAYLDFQNMKPWETNIIDTFQYWRFGDYKNYTSLKLLAACLDIPSPKDDIDGSMVGPLFWNGNKEEREKNLKRIVRYCEKDVITTANIILKLKNIPVVSERDVYIIQ